ncbi:noggin-3-like [Argonauta hians]
MKSGSLAMLWYIFNSFMLNELIASNLYPQSLSISDYGLQRIFRNNPFSQSIHESRRILTTKPKRRRKKKLLQILGKDFNPNIMSINKPKNSNGSLKYIDYPIDTMMLDQVKDLKINLTYDNNTAMIPDLQLIAAIKKWLVKKSSCPVEYTWINIGEFFWPSWIRQGNCIDSGQCSWPPGMRCVSAKSKIINILRWNCKHRLRNSGSNKSKSTNSKPSSTKSGINRRKNHRRRCRWDKIPYPITDECFCTC